MIAGKTYGKGTSQVQRDGTAMLTSVYDAERSIRDRFEEIATAETIVRQSYEGWREKNAGMNVHRHWEMLEPIVALGEPGLRVIFTMMRGTHHWLFVTANQIIAKLGLPPIEIPEDLRGRIEPITDLYLSWADKHFPPTAAELMKSAVLATNAANEGMWFVVAPDLGSNYGGTYFSGSLKSAQKLYARAEALRERAIAIILAQQDDWKDENSD